MRHRDAAAGNVVALHDVAHGRADPAVERLVERALFCIAVAARRQGDAAHHGQRGTVLHALQEGDGVERFHLDAIVAPGLLALAIASTALLTSSLALVRSMAILSMLRLTGSEIGIRFSASAQVQPSSRICKMA